jgi:hypothetical protein
VVVHPTHGYYTLVRMPGVAQRYAELTLVLGVRTPPAGADEGFSGVALTYQEADGVVHSQSIMSGYEICSVTASEVATKAGRMHCDAAFQLFSAAMAMRS